MVISTAVWIPPAWWNSTFPPFASSLKTILSTPLRYAFTYSARSRLIFATSSSDNTFTTETPTQGKPPTCDVFRAIELAARVEGRQDDLQRGDFLRRVLVDGDAPVVVFHSNRLAVLVQRHVDLRGVAVRRLIHRVVDDLPDEVMQPRLARPADVHARPLADGLKALKDLNGGAVVGFGGGGWHGWGDDVLLECTEVKQLQKGQELSFSKSTLLLVAEALSVV